VANGEDAILLWKEAESEVSCRQYFQISKDRGETWGPRQTLLDNLPGCPETNNFMTRDDGLILLEQTRFDQLYLLAWNGIEWSNPQPQQAIDNFIDPETLKPLELGCRKTAMKGGFPLVLVGCDSGATQDIWLTSRNLESVSQWFPMPSNWRQPTTVATGLSDLTALKMVADTQGRLHVVWSQQAPDLPSADGENSINYALWENNQWVVSPDILTPPSGRVREMDVALDSGERIFVVWSGGQSGEVYYSWANAGLANSVSEWATPVALPSFQNVGSDPEILISETGIIYVIYAVSLNEGRGIYLVKSTDGGSTWSDPIRVFDGVAAEWEMVDQPHLSLSSQGSLHAVWNRNTLPGRSGPVALYYSRSEDQGGSWTEPEMVIEAPVIWSQIQGVGGNSVHRIWQEIENDSTSIWFEVSLDNGLTWSRPTNISGLGIHYGSTTLIGDSIGRLHLLHLSEEASGNLILRQWSWDGVDLNVGESLNLGVGKLAQGVVIAADITSAGDLAAIILDRVEDPISGQVSYEFLFTGRTIELPDGVPTRLSQPTTEVQSTLEPTPTGEASPTPTTTPFPDAGLVSTENQPGGWMGIPEMSPGTFLVITTTGVLILLTVYIGIRSREKN
jgi:hypothetical protein